MQYVLNHQEAVGLVIVGQIRKLLKMLGSNRRSGNRGFSIAFPSFSQVLTNQHVLLLLGDVTKRRTPHCSPLDTLTWFRWPSSSSSLYQGVCRRRMYLNGVKGVWSCWTCFGIKRTPPSAPFSPCLCRDRPKEPSLQNFFFLLEKVRRLLILRWKVFI